MSLYLLYANNAAFQKAVYWSVLLAAVHATIRVVDAGAVVFGFASIRHVTMFVSNYAAFLAVGASMLATTSLQVFYGEVSSMPTLFGLTVYAALAVLGETVYYEVRDYRRVELKDLRKSSVRFATCLCVFFLLTSLATHAICTAIASLLSASDDPRIHAGGVFLFWLHVVATALGVLFLCYGAVRFKSPSFDSSAWAVGLSFAGKAALMATGSFVAASSFPNTGTLSALSPLVKQSGIATVSNLALLQWMAWGADVAFVVAIFAVDFEERMKSLQRLKPLPPPAEVVVDKPTVLERLTLRRRTMKAEIKAMKERIQDDERQLV